MITIENLTNPGADPVDGDMIQITHQSGAIERRRHWHAAPPPEPAMHLEITALTSSDPQAQIESGEVTCAAGATVSATVEIRTPDGTLIPVTVSFRMPIVARDGRERILLASFVDGVATVQAALPESGVWLITEAQINAGLPAENRMKFSGLSIYVVQ